MGSESAASIVDRIHEDGTLSVEDDGPGFSLFDAEGHPFAERALTELHRGPTLDGHAPHEHVAAHGLGVFCVCALASHLTLDVHQAGTHGRQEFARGRASSAPAALERAPLFDAGLRHGSPSSIGGALFASRFIASGPQPTAIATSIERFVRPARRGLSLEKDPESRKSRGSLR